MASEVRTNDDPAEIVLKSFLIQRYFAWNTEIRREMDVDIFVWKKIHFGFSNYFLLLNICSYTKLYMHEFCS